MGKLDMAAIGRYLGLGGGAVGLPAVVNKFAAAGTMLAKIPMWNTEFFGITIGGLILASAGILIVDQYILK